MLKTLFLASAGVVCAAASGPALGLDVTQNDDPDALVNTILGTGITLVPGSPQYVGASSAAGTFSSGSGSGIGLDTGILLSSGSVLDAPGPNSSDSITTAHGLPGDTDLNALVSPFATNDAAVLEFDFQSNTGNVSFNYVFASDEYNEYVNTEFDDVFGFFLNGTNIGTVPGTNDRVSVNSVNCNNPFDPPTGQNCQFYNNNDLSDGGGTFDIEYDGFTDVFTAVGAVTPGATNHIKLAIADTSDQILDATVFIQGGTFSGEPVSPSVPDLQAGGTSVVALSVDERRLAR